VTSVGANLSSKTDSGRSASRAKLLLHGGNGLSRKVESPQREASG
jgi:hypothetical protein